MLKDLFDKGKCALGFHVDAWQYLRPGSCQQTSSCARCRAVNQRILHDWPDAWSLVAPDDCRTVRTCRRCSDRELGIEHQWQEPDYVAEGVCDRIRVCVRCRSTMSADVAHDFSAWTYTEDDACAQAQTCSRCGLAGVATRTLHDWTPWQHSAFYEAQVRVCRRCGEMPFDVDPGDDDDPMSLQRAARAVEELAAADDVPELRKRLVAHQRELWSPVADRYFRLAFAHADGDAGRIETLDVLRRLIDRCRVEGIDTVLAAAMAPPPLPPTAAPADASAPSGLTGHWRHTESFASGGVSLATDTHLVLDASGLFEWWSKSAGSMGYSSGERERGRWSAADGVLRLTFDGGSGRSLKYSVTRDSMFCPEEPRYRLWKRIDGAR